MKKITNKYKKFTILLVTLFLISCNNNFTVSTNLDTSNFRDYFSPGQVTIYQSEEEITKRYKFIGAVEGEDCQLKEHHAAPNEINARTDARRQAFKQQANAIIFTGCATINVTTANQQPQKKQCLSTLVCYGKSYQIDINAEAISTDKKQ